MDLASNKSVFALVVLIIAILIVRVHYDNAKWKDFAREHDCRKTAEIRPARDGEWTRSAYVCNDGVTYWR